MDWSPLNLCIRATLLFLTGCFFAVVLNLLQVQNNITLFPEDTTSWTYRLLYSAWWVPPSVGTGAVIIGIAYPCFDSIHVFDQTTKEPIGWSSVIRCVALFVGINHASAKIIFTNNFQLSMSLAAMSFGLWWLFDRSRTGLILGIIVAILATSVAMILVYNGVYQYKDPDFFYIRSWLPCIFFSGGVTFGSIGRQLANENFKRLIWTPTSAVTLHEHQD